MCNVFKILDTFIGFLSSPEPIVITDGPLEQQMKKVVNRIRAQFGGLSQRRMRQIVAAVIFIVLLIIAFVLVQNGNMLPPPAVLKSSCMGVYTADLDI